MYYSFCLDVDLTVFLSFNKIRKLNCTADEIRKAISKSELIELSDDNTKIRRKKPVVVKDNVDECTIYVENIKADADHEWLRHFFSDFGNVVYVSIPKYRHRKGNKGFAFVEFENECDAQTALNYFESIGCKMPSDTNPDELISVKTFVADGGDKNSDEQSAECETAIRPDEGGEKESKKRRLSLQDEKPDKRFKADSEDETAGVQQTGDAMQQGDESENKKKKKHKKDKKKGYIRDLGLKILSK